MKARLLRAWGGQYAGQIMSNVKESDFPSGVAEFFEDDDPAINVVREPSPLGASGVNHVAEDGTVPPIKGSDFEKGQLAKVKQVEEQHEAQQTAHAEALAETEKKAQEGSKAPAAKSPAAKPAANMPTAKAPVPPAAKKPGKR